MYNKISNHAQPARRWEIRFLCLVIFLSAVIGFAGSVAAQGPEDKGAMVPTSDFLVREETLVDEQAAIAVPQEQVQYCYDPYEYDDYQYAANWLSVGIPQRHAFCHQWDRDYMLFSARAGATYFIETSGLDWNADTVLELYDRWGNLIAQDDDGGAERWASRIAWTATTSDTFYVLARQFDPYRAGSGTGYTIGLQMGVTPSADQVWVDRGCGSSYGIGEWMRVYMRVGSAGYYQLTVFTNSGTRTAWSGYLSPGTYYLNGRVGSPTGPHTLTLHGNYPPPSCTFYVSYVFSPGASDMSKGPSGGQATAQELPDATVLDTKDSEW